MVETVVVIRAITMFVKLNQQSRQYACSKKFTIANPQDNELYDVVRVMKRIIDWNTACL